MAVEERQFESEFGFKSPGFTVDRLGNITATSINAAGAGGGGSASGDFTVTEVSENFRVTSNTVIVGSGDNPTLAFVRGQEYSFTLDLSLAPISFNILDSTGLIRYNNPLKIIINFHILYLNRFITLNFLIKIYFYKLLAC